MMNVRFEGINGHDADATRCLLMTQSGHLVASNLLGPPCKAAHVGTGALGQNIQDHTDPGQVGKLAMDQ
jgi:hypothetical protein